MSYFHAVHKDSAYYSAWEHKKIASLRENKMLQYLFAPNTHAEVAIYTHIYKS